MRKALNANETRFSSRTPAVRPRRTGRANQTLLHFGNTGKFAISTYCKSFIVSAIKFFRTCDTRLSDVRKNCVTGAGNVARWSWGMSTLFMFIKPALAFENFPCPQGGGAP